MRTTFKLACAGVALAAAISPAPALAASAVQFLGFGSTFTGFSTEASTRSTAPPDITPWVT